MEAITAFGAYFKAETEILKHKQRHSSSLFVTNMERAGVMFSSNAVNILFIYLII